MINIYDDMNNLVSNFNKLEEVTEFKKILEDLKKEENKEVWDDIQKFQNLNMEINSMQMLGQKIPDENIEESKKEYEKLTNNEMARNYFEKELAITNLVTELNKIFVKGVTDIYGSMENGNS